MKSLSPDNQSRFDQSRAGLITPAVAFALIVVMLCLALVLDRLWLDAAVVELTTCAEAAALASARELACDDTLRSECDPETRVATAREAAARIAAANLVAGTQVQLDSEQGGDIRVGRLSVDSETGQTTFLETVYDPTTTVVTVQRSREYGNPIALYLCGLTGQWAGDAASRAEASIDNHVIGIRPLADSTAPMIPLAILNDAPADSEVTGWQTQIVDGQGTDEFGFDETTNQIMTEPDGIREIVLKSMKYRDDPEKSNVRIVDFSSNMREQPVAQQVMRGCSREDLRAFGGELVMGEDPLLMNCGGIIAGQIVQSCQDIVGQRRICLLYQNSDVNESTGFGNLSCIDLVVVRIMSVRQHERDGCEIVLQPSVMATRSAILGDKQTETNPYLYKLHLTQ